MKILHLIFLVFIVTCSFAQESKDYKVYRNLKKALKNKDKVELLNLSGKGLTEFPEEILQLKNLKVLNLTNNKIEAIPKEINQLMSLERLELMKNELSELPIELSDLKNLERINVAYNGMSEGDVEELQKALPDCLIITYIEL